MAAQEFDPAHRAATLPLQPQQRQRAFACLHAGRLKLCRPRLGRHARGPEDCARLLPQWQSARFSDLNRPGLQDP
jgi:hypothetical protein